MTSFIGDEILAVNGSILHGLNHGDAIAIFKSIRSGPVVLKLHVEMWEVHLHQMCRSNILDKIFNLEDSVLQTNH